MNRIKVTQLAISKDLLIPGVDLLEAGHRAACLLGDPAGERLRPFLLRDVVLGDVAVEVGLECPTLTPGRRGSRRTREKGVGAAEDNR